MYFSVLFFLFLSHMYTYFHQTPKQQRRKLSGWRHHLRGLCTVTLERGRNGSLMHEEDGTAGGGPCLCGRKKKSALVWVCSSSSSVVFVRTTTYHHHHHHNHNPPSIQCGIFFGEWERKISHRFAKKRKRKSLEQKTITRQSRTQM